MANLRANNLTGTGGRNAITGAVYFGGDNDTGGLTIADTTDLELGSETNWTIEFWIKLNHSALSDWDVIMGKGSDDNGGTEYEWFVEVMSGDHLIFLSTTDGEAWDFNQQITPALVVGEWYHVAIVRNGSGANTLKSYVNGVQYSTHTSQNIYTGNDEFGIGHFGHTNGLNSDVTLSNVRVVKGTSVYTAAFTPPTEKLTVITNTVLLCCQDSVDATQEKTGKTITVVGNAKATKDTPSVGVDEGVTFEGDTKVNSQGHMYFPTGNTEQRGRGRGVIVAGENPSQNKSISYVQIQSGGIAKDFGDLTKNCGENKAVGSSTRGVIHLSGDNPNTRNTLEYITFATTSNSIDFGDLVAAWWMRATGGNETRGLFAGGLYPGSTFKNDVDYITIATLGNALDFGDLQTARNAPTGCASPTRFLVAGGQSGPATSDRLNTIDYFTIATTGNYTDFGDLTAGGKEGCAAASSTRGVFGPRLADPGIVNTIDYVTIASTGNATDFGDGLTARAGSASLSNSIRGAWAGGYTPSKVNSIEFVNIATTSNAFDFGDITYVNQYGGGCSDSHGGLS